MNLTHFSPTQKRHFIVKSTYMHFAITTIQQYNQNSINYVEPFLFEIKSSISLPVLQIKYKTIYI